MISPFLTRLLALLLAGIYFSFQAEFSDEEYEQNHPTSNGTLCFTGSSLNWESFDKENVRAAVRVRPLEPLVLFARLGPPMEQTLPASAPFHLVACNSPPEE